MSTTCYDICLVTTVYNWCPLHRVEDYIIVNKLRPLSS